MKATVISAFVDKHTGKKYLAGVDYEGTEARISELAKAGHVERAEVQEPEPAAEPKRRSYRKSKKQDQE